jgi:hypothetical protein
MMESMLALVFMLGLPVWLAVEQIVLATQSTRPTPRRLRQRVVSAVAYQDH